MYGTPISKLDMGQCPGGALPLENRSAFGAERLDQVKLLAYSPLNTANHTEVFMSVISAFERRAMEIVAMDDAEAWAQAEEAAMKGISVRLPEHLVLLLDNIAKELRTTRSDVVQTILSNGAEDAAQALADQFAPEDKRVSYFKALHGPDIESFVWGEPSPEGGE